MPKLIHPWKKAKSKDFIPSSNNLPYILSIKELNLLTDNLKTILRAKYKSYEHLHEDFIQIALEDFIKRSKTFDPTKVQNDIQFIFYFTRSALRQIKLTIDRDNKQRDINKDNYINENHYEQLIERQDPMENKIKILIPGFDEFLIDKRQMCFTNSTILRVVFEEFTVETTNYTIVYPHINAKKIQNDEIQEHQGKQTTKDETKDNNSQGKQKRKSKYSKI